MNIEKSDFVKELFNNIAPCYDLLNFIISTGKHKQWKIIAINQLELQNNDIVMDLCTGTADIALAILQKNIPDNNLYAIDFSTNMLNIAKDKLKNYPNTHIIEADALNLPFENNYFDKIIVSFGIRNLNSIDSGFNEIFRVLKPSGIFVNIDFGKPKKTLPKTIFKLYFDIIVPIIGFLFKKRKEYSYLTDSIKTFPPPAVLADKLTATGFKNVTITNCFEGFVSIQKAEK